MSSERAVCCSDGLDMSPTSVQALHGGLEISGVFQVLRVELTGRQLQVGTEDSEIRVTQVASLKLLEPRMSSESLRALCCSDGLHMSPTNAQAWWH